MLLTTISGTYNRLPLLTRMIESVRADLPVGFTHQFIICDGGSTDGTLEYLRTQPDVVLIEHGELRGAINAFTETGHLSQSKYTLILNDDIEVMPGTIIRAVVHLEDNKHCGMVAFYDDRAVPGYWRQGQFHVLHMAARKNGAEIYVVYGQCCMVRTWLGKEMNWWRGHDERFAEAKTYAGDNMLSALIWSHGYTVDDLEECRVIDHVFKDDLRTINHTTAENDGKLFYSVYPDGVDIGPEPTLPQQHERQLRVLYLPVYEPGHPVQKQQKRGLRDALAKAYIVQELDYVAYKDHPAALRSVLFQLIDQFKPDVLLTQLHGADIISPGMLSDFRAYHPRMVVVNWNGDVWPHGLTSPEMLQLLRHVDLQLTVNDSVLPVYEQNHIPAAYWQIGFEDPPEPLPDAPAHDVLFLGNAYSEERKALESVLTSLADVNVGMYGSGWQNSLGNTTYDFAMGAALYRNAKIAIGDNQFPDQRGFVSNRIFQALAAGGALLLHQRVEGLKELTGLQGGVHFVEWTTLDELRQWIRYFLDPANEKDRLRIAKSGARFTRYFHSFDARVQQLSDLVKTKARRQPRPARAMVFTGAMDTFGLVGAATQKHYQVTRMTPIMVDELDAPYLLQQNGWVEYGR